MKKKNARRGGMGVVSFLTILFVVLRIANVISWPWLWVLAPIWVSLLTAILVFGCVLIAGKVKKGKW